MYCIGLFLYLPMASSNQTEHINDSCHGDLALHDLGPPARSAAAPRQVCETTEKVRQIGPIGLAFCFICDCDSSYLMRRQRDGRDEAGGQQGERAWTAVELQGGRQKDVRRKALVGIGACELCRNHLTLCSKSFMVCRLVRGHWNAASRG